jgi:Ser/Thr protein kinase RdoA (MazF antagonist)
MQASPSAQATDLDQVAEQIARQFLPHAADLRLQRLGQGLINDTRLVEDRSERFVLQRLNSAVFKDADAIVANLLQVQEWLHGQAEVAVRLPQLFCAANGSPILRDETGHAWRLMEFIGDSRTLRPLQHPAQAAEVGRVLGDFHRALAGLNPSLLRLTLPGLHDTPCYKRRLDTVMAAAPNRREDPRVAEAVEQIQARAGLISVLQQARAAGTAATQITHGDPKLDNVLFARDADRALCLIDLDTVQPGLLHEDIADCVRSCCNRVGSATAGTLSTGFDLVLFDALLSGYATAAAPLFDADSLALVYPAIRLIPVELAIRFLTDDLEGNRYFRVSHARENLDKAMVQLALTRDIERQRGDIERIISNRFAPKRPRL